VIQSIDIAIATSVETRCADPSKLSSTVNGGSIWRMPKPSTPTSHKTTPSISTALESSSQEAFYEAIEILAKKGNKYKVSWAGINPDTGKQWEPSWVQYWSVYSQLIVGTEREL
jgi:hypothetical protein